MTSPGLAMESGAHLRRSPRRHSSSQARTGALGLSEERTVSDLRKDLRSRGLDAPSKLTKIELVSDIRVTELVVSDAFLIAVSRCFDFVVREVAVE